jgi:hypothetical protein
MPEAIIEYKNGTKKVFDYFYGGEFMAAQKASELFRDEGHLASHIYTINWENELDDVYKWEDEPKKVCAPLLTDEQVFINGGWGWMQKQQKDTQA